MQLTRRYKRLTNEHKKMIEDNMPLFKSAFMAAHSNEWNEDLYQMLLVDICDKIATYDPARGAFSTWVYLRARTVVNHYYYTQKRPKRSKYKEVSLYSQGYADDELCIIENIIGDTDSGYDNIDNDITAKQAVDEILKCCHLTPKQKKFVHEVIVNGKDLATLHKDWGVSRQNVHMMAQNIRKKILRYRKDIIYDRNNN